MSDRSAFYVGTSTNFAISLPRRMKWLGFNKSGKRSLHTSVIAVWWMNLAPSIKTN